MNSNKRARSWMEHWKCNLNIHKLKYRYIYIDCNEYCMHNSIHILYICTYYIYTYMYISCIYIYMYIYIYIYIYRVYIYIDICIYFNSNFKKPRSMCISTVACHLNVKGNFYHQIAKQPMSPEKIGTNETRDIGHAFV